MRAEPFELIEAVIVLHHAKEQSLQSIGLAFVELSSAFSEQIRKSHVNGVQEEVALNCNEVSAHVLSLVFVERTSELPHEVDEFVLKDAAFDRTFHLYQLLTL